MPEDTFPTGYNQDTIRSGQDTQCRGYVWRRYVRCGYVRKGYQVTGYVLQVRPSNTNKFSSLTFQNRSCFLFRQTCRAILALCSHLPCWALASTVSPSEPCRPLPFRTSSRQTHADRCHIGLLLSDPCRQLNYRTSSQGTKSTISKYDKNQ